MKPASFRRAALPLFFFILVAIAVALMFALRNGGGESGGRDAYFGDRSDRAHGLADAPQARFVSLFVSNSEGVASLMIGGRTDEFKTITQALKDAEPVDGKEDESFSDLLVIYFGEEDTMEVSYSRSRNLIDWGGAVYRPPLDLAPVLKTAEEKTAS